MDDRQRRLWLAHDGPVPPAEMAAARWGAGAAERLARGARAVQAEARLRACLAALARLGRAGVARGAIGRLVDVVSIYRREALRARK